MNKNLDAVRENQQEQFEEYEKELEKLQVRGLQPIGINEHLESFKRYLDWKKRTKDLFDLDDSAKDLL